MNNNVIKNNVIKWLAKAVSTDKTRPHLQKIFYSVKNNELFATDGHRIHVLLEARKHFPDFAAIPYDTRFQVFKIQGKLELIPVREDLPAIPDVRKRYSVSTEGCPEVTVFSHKSQKNDRLHYDFCNVVLKFGSAFNFDYFRDAVDTGRILGEFTVTQPEPKGSLIFKLTGAPEKLVALVLPYRS